MYHVYVLYSQVHDKIYIGSTSDLQARFLSHNELATTGWMIKFRPWKLVYSEEFQSRSEALKREKQLKTARGREFIWNEIIAKL